MEKLPSLGQIESAAAEEYRRKYGSSDTASGSRNDSHELADLQLREFHAFKLYQFFERWALLVKNNDIDYRSANEYMHTYKNWWLENFIVAWLNKESDEYIHTSLSEIIKYLQPNRTSGRSWRRGKKSSDAEEIKEDSSKLTDRN